MISSPTSHCGKAFLPSLSGDHPLGLHIFIHPLSHCRSFLQNSHHSLFRRRFQSPLEYAGPVNWLQRAIIFSRSQRDVRCEEFLLSLLGNHAFANVSLPPSKRNLISIGKYRCESTFGQLFASSTSHLHRLKLPVVQDTSSRFLLSTIFRTQILVSQSSSKAGSPVTPASPPDPPYPASPSHVSAVQSEPYDVIHSLSTLPHCFPQATQHAPSP